MPACSICYERFSSPVSLPCGHVFCRDCIRRTVDSLPSTSTGQHACPSCRSPYTLQGLNPTLIPDYLRPYLLPSVRPLYFDADSSPASSPGAASVSSEPLPARPTPCPIPTPSAKSLPGNALSTHVPIPLPPLDTPLHAISQSTLCRLLGELHTWRHRAETHAAGNASLLSFARSAKEHAFRMRAERDCARSRCTLLKRKLIEVDSAWTQPSAMEDIAADRLTSARRPKGLPVFVMQAEGKRSPPRRNHSVTPSEPSRLGPPLKRRKTSLGDVSALDSGVVTVRGEDASTRPHASNRRIAISALLSPTDDAATWPAL